MMFRPLVSLPLLSVALVWAAPARATVLLSLTTEELTDQASVVVRGRVMAQQVVTDAGRIWTDTTLRISAVLKGPVAADRAVVVRQPGGQTATGGMHVAGAARFQRGEEVLVFLRPVAGFYIAVGMCQGKYRIYRDAGGVERAQRELSDASFVALDAQGRVSFQRPSSADVALATVVSAMRQQGSRQRGLRQLRAAPGPRRAAPGRSATGGAR